VILFLISQYDIYDFRLHGNECIICIHMEMSAFSVLG